MDRSGRAEFLVVDDGVLDTRLAAWLESDLLQRAKGRSPKHWRLVARRAATVARWSGGDRHGRGSIALPTVSLDLTRAAQELRAMGELTAVQTVVVVRLLLGDSNKALMQCLSAELKTVEAHVASVLHALGVDSRAQLWSLVYRREIERALAAAG